MSNKEELDEVFFWYDKACKVEDEIRNVLKKFDTENEKVSETLFNVYPDEMKAIVVYVVGCTAKDNVA